MIITLPMIMIILLGIIAIIDWKFKQIPSVFLTAMIFATALINYDQPSFHFGIISFILAWMLYEFDFIGGIADVKYITIIGFLIGSLQAFFTFTILIMVFGLIYKGIFRFVLKKHHTILIPFIPCLYAVYLALYFVRMVL